MAENETTPEQQAQADAKAKAEADAKNGGGSGDEEVKVSKTELERLKKLDEESSNKSKAIDEERKARKDAEAKLKAIDDANAKAKEEELKKSGKYEEIISTKDTEIETLRKENSEYKGFYEKAQSEMTAENTKLLGEIPAGEKEFVNEAIAGKDLPTQNRLLKTFADKFKKPDFGKGAGGDGTPNADDKKKAEEEEAKKGGFKSFAGSIAKDIFSRKTN